MDDQEFNLKAIEIILRYKLKIDVDKVCVKATSGQQALDIIKEDMAKHKYTKSSFKLILMDYEMPGMNGPETTNHIRESLFVEQIDQPIIVAVTGHSDEKFIKDSIDSGMNLVFTKIPFPEKEMLDLMIRCNIQF